MARTTPGRYYNTELVVEEDVLFAQFVFFRSAHRGDGMQCSADVGGLPGASDAAMFAGEYGLGGPVPFDPGVVCPSEVSVAGVRYYLDTGWELFWVYHVGCGPGIHRDLDSDGLSDRGVECGLLKFLL